MALPYDSRSSAPPLFTARTITSLNRVQALVSMTNTTNLCIDFEFSDLLIIRIARTVKAVALDSRAGRDRIIVLIQSTTIATGSAALECDGNVEFLTFWVLLSSATFL